MKRKDSLKNLKKVIMTAMIAVVVGGTAFAAATDMEPAKGNGYYMATKPMQMSTGRYEAMGLAGVALNNDQDALWTNPANLASGKWSWHLPSAAVTVYNVKDILKSDLAKDAVGGEMKDDMTGYATDLIGIYGKAGYGEIARIDSTVGVKAPHFGFAGDVQLNLFTYVPSEDKTQMSVIPQVDVGLSAGLALSLMKGNPVSFDIGVTGRVAYRGYFSKLDMNTFLNASQSEDMMQMLLDSTPVVAAMALPVDVGVNVNLPAGFSVGAVCRNLNGSYNTVSWYENVNAVSQNDFKENPFKIEVKPSFDIGLAWQPDFGGWGWIAEPQVAVDLKGVDTVFKDGFTKEALLQSLHAGVELQFLKLVEVRAGVSGGYTTVGAGIDLLHLIHLEATYGHQMFPLGNGTKNVDKLMIRANILWER